MGYAQLDQSRQEKAKEYARIHRRLMLADLALTALFALAWLAFGWSAALRDWLEGFTTNPWLLVPLYAAVFGGIYYLIDLPLSYYSGFVLPHRFGQSNQTLRGWITDQVKNLAVGGVLGVILLEVIYAVLRSAPDTWWIWASIILLFLSVVMAILAPVLLMPIFYKFIPLGEEYQDYPDGWLLTNLFAIDTHPWEGHNGKCCSNNRGSSSCRNLKLHLMIISNGHWLSYFSREFSSER